jgi:hypothetical protein
MRDEQNNKHRSHLNKLFNFVCDGRCDENDEALRCVLDWSEKM